MRRQSYESNGINATRRHLLKMLGVSAVISGAGYFAYDNLREKGEEVEEFSSNFEKELSGYLALIELQHDQVLFVDEDNVPVGNAVEFEDIIAPKRLGDGTVIENYQYSAGTVGENGVLTDVPTLEWREKIKEIVEAQYPERQIEDSYNVVRLFQSACNYEDEPELKKGINDGSIVSYADLVDYYAEKPVRDNEESNRYEYVHEAIEFDNDIPEIVQETLRELIPGICAQESKFNNGLTSKSGAIGIFQFMPWVWEKYGKSEDDIKSLKTQVDVAGKLFSDIYSEFLHHSDEDSLLQARSQFDDQDSFLRDFVVPALINSYNAGSARMGDAVNAYFSSSSRSRSLTGKDIFQEMIEFAKSDNSGRLDAYREDAREYVPRVYAHAIAIHERQT